MQLFFIYTHEDLGHSLTFGEIIYLQEKREYFSAIAPNKFTSYFTTAEVRGQANAELLRKALEKLNEAYKTNEEICRETKNKYDVNDKI